MSRIAPSTWALRVASACLSFAALCLLAMAASLWVADRYQVFGVFAHFLPSVLHPHIGVTGCMLFHLSEASKLAGMSDTLFASKSYVFWPLCASSTLPVSAVCLPTCCSVAALACDVAVAKLLWGCCTIGFASGSVDLQKSNDHHYCHPGGPCFLLLCCCSCKVWQPLFDCLQITQLAWVIYCTC